jgi:broad specificity phosphatase PhoE
MALIYIVRHGKAAASFTDDIDPGLDPSGVTQAQLSCAALQKHLPLVIKSSPLKRARETALPLLASTGQVVEIESRLAEIPSPGISLQDRGPWLQQIMAGQWSQQTQALRDWRQGLIHALLSVDTDTAIFSHYVAINTAVGAATDDDQVMIFRPDNGSITILETDGKSLKLVQRGAEADTKVN